MSKTFDRFTGLIFLVIGAAALVQSQNISESSYGSNVGPNIFPLGIGLFVLLLSIRLIYETFQYKGEGKEKESPDYNSFLIILVSAIYMRYSSKVSVM